MRLTKYTFVMVCATLVGTIGLVRPSFVGAAEDRFAAYFQPADEDTENDELETDDPPPAEEMSDEEPSDEMPEDDETPPDEMPADETPPEEMPADEMPEDDAPPAEVPNDDEPQGQLPADDARDETNPPKPEMEDQAPTDTDPVRRIPVPDADSKFAPKYDTIFPGDNHGAPSASGERKGWGYNGGCCSGVWDGYCDELHGCHRCRCGRSKLWCRIMCRKSKTSCGRSNCCGSQHGSCCCQASASSCCRAPGKTGGDSVAPPVPSAPVPPAPVPYDSAAKPKQGHKGSSVVRKQWDMPRMKPNGGKTRK